jgi:MFS family permease
MQTVLGILTLVAGVALPMAMVGWLAMRLGRKPRPPARLIGLVLAFNGVLPLGLILLGLGLLKPEFWAATVVRVGTFTALLAAAIILGLIIAARAPTVPAGGRDA